MKVQQIFSGAVLATGAMAARPWLNEADTGIDLVLGDLPVGELPDLEQMVGLPDYEWAARNYMSDQNYTYYRNGAGGEWSYRNNMEIFQQFRFRPRAMVDVSKIQDSLPTTILGHNFSAPFYISSCARASMAHPDAELNLVRGAAAGDILYFAALYADKTLEEIHEAKAKGQVVFQQLYINELNDTETQELLDRSKAAGADAIVFTIDSPADGNRHRAVRFGVGSTDPSFNAYTWDFYHKLTNMTDLPIVLKGVGSVETAKEAVENGVPAIVLSNHGGRQVDGAQSSLETALEIHNEAPEVFEQLEVYADGGVRYGSDVLKLLSLGVRAVGLGRPYMYANVFGQPGIEKVTEQLKYEISIDAGNVGIADLKKINPTYINWKALPGLG